MTIDIGNGGEPVKVLLGKNLKIPPYQRPYSWREETALQLLDDIRDAMRQGNDVPYVLGAVVLHKDKDTLNVVDGQQRLLTLRILLKLLNDTECYDKITNTNTAKDTPPIVRVINALKREINASVDKTVSDGNASGCTKQADEKLISFINDNCQMICIVTDDIDEAFHVFDSQNYRGKALAPHDLLKAYHLRAMRCETEVVKVAVVDAWESADDVKLDRLFSLYLYRIARWARGESAPQFTVHDIGLFTGISPSQDHTPYALFNIAAQNATSLLLLADTKRSNEECRALKHARFQLDAPWAAGRSFFEGIAFMLNEVDRLTKDIKVEIEPLKSIFPFYRVSDDGSTENPPSRYRYVADLYLAVALYYTNKFGEDNFKQMRDLLFAWAYAPRIEKLRVQYQSINNLACDSDPKVSAFKRIRNAVSARDLRGLRIHINTNNGDNHESELVEFLKGKGFEINGQKQSN